MRRRLRLTRVGWFFVVAIVATALLNVFVPEAGMIAAIVLVLVVLAALSEGFMGDSEGTHEAWAGVEAERKREALRRHAGPPR